MAKPGEVATITSQAQYDLFLKQCNSGFDKTDKHHNPVLDQDGNRAKKTTPLGPEGMARNARRDETGQVVEPGGGKADTPPSQNQACQALFAFRASGGRRSALPEKADTKDAHKAAKTRPRKVGVEKGKGVWAPPVEPRGTKSYNSRMRKQDMMAASKEYLSKSINESFSSALDDALGL